MKASELHKKSALELQNELMSLRKEQFALRLQRATPIRMRCCWLSGLLPLPRRL